VTVAKVARSHSGGRKAAGGEHTPRCTVWDKLASETSWVLRPSEKRFRTGSFSNKNNSGAKQ